MNTLTYVLAVLAIGKECFCLAGESSYFRSFQSECGDKAVPFQVTSGPLVDTNNSLPTVRGKPVSLSMSGIGGVRIGMSMDQVVALWGKPVSIGCCMAGRPSFSYDDVWVRFETNEVMEIGLYTSRPWTPQFAGGLVPISRQEEWMRSLGKPQRLETNDSIVSIYYETNHTRMTLTFDIQDKQLSGLLLKRPTTREAGTKNEER